MAPTILSVAKELIAEYTNENWKTEKDFQQLSFLLCHTIGQLSETLGRDAGEDADELSDVIYAIGNLQNTVAPQLAGNPTQLARFEGMTYALEKLLESAQVHHKVRIRQQQRADRLIPLIGEVQSALESHDQEEIEIDPSIVKKLCLVLGYDLADIVYTSDICPMPLGNSSEQLQCDLIWLSDHGHIGTMVFAAVGWAFADSLVS